MVRSKLLLVPAAIVLLGVPAFAWAQPAAVICGLAAVSGLKGGPEHTFFHETLSAQVRSEFLRLLPDARQRVGDVLWAPESTPQIIVLDGSPLFGFLPYNLYASAMALPYKTCLLIGPKGRSIDVVAHEIVHSEVAFAAGYWQYLTRIPRWLDEGIAMQVDRRTNYHSHAILDGGKRRVLKHSGGSFHRATGRELTSRYASAKAVVSELIVEHGPRAVREALTNGNIETLTNELPAK